MASPMPELAPVTSAAVPTSRLVIVGEGRDARIPNTTRFSTQTWDSLRRSLQAAQPGSARLRQSTVTASFPSVPLAKSESASGTSAN